MIACCAQLCFIRLADKKKLQSQRYFIQLYLFAVTIDVLLNMQVRVEIFSNLSKFHTDLHINSFFLGMTSTVYVLS